MAIRLDGSENGAYGFFMVSCDGPRAPFNYKELACADPGLCNQLIFSPSPGDTITITVTATASQDSAVVDDATAGMVTSQTGNGFTAAAAEFIDTKASATIPGFTKVRFADCTVDGTPLSAHHPTSFSMRRSRRANGTTQVKVGPLNRRGERLHHKVRASLVGDRSQSAETGLGESEASSGVTNPQSVWG